MMHLMLPNLTFVCFIEDFAARSRCHWLDITSQCFRAPKVGYGAV